MKGATDRGGWRGGGAAAGREASEELFWPLRFEATESSLCTQYRIHRISPDA
jgi:hypothetical protein